MLAFHLAFLFSAAKMYVKFPRRCLEMTLNFAFSTESVKCVKTIRWKQYFWFAKEEEVKVRGRSEEQSLRLGFVLHHRQSPLRSHYDRRMSGRIRFSSDLESSRARYSMRKVVRCMRHCYVHMHVHSICTRANDFIANTEWEREIQNESKNMSRSQSYKKMC